ncbi:MAG TPA: GNAT family N-acetyltransferase [Acidimicrobiales bacterium]
MIGLDTRPAVDGDQPAVLALLQASLGWVPDEAYERFFAWKHRESPFGPSPAWVAVDGDRIVGFRTFMRWEFTRGGEVVRAVRAVDTATHPDYQGRGIFSSLTRHALDELAADGVAFVFNTPNDKSRPGYLKLGWRLVGRLPVAARPRSLPALVRVARARTAADKWSAETDAGVPAPEALGDREAVARWLKAIDASTDAHAGADVLRTHRTPEYLAWRYGFGPLRYRALTVGDGEGLVVFRVRRRGEAREAAVCEELLPDDERLRAEARRAVVKATGADHAVLIGPARPSRGLLPVPGHGPTLVWRAVTDDESDGENVEAAVPGLDAWGLTLGDVELF